MKQLLRHLLRRLGYELVHRTDDPVLLELRKLYETLRLDPQNRLRWDDALPQPSAHASLRHLLQLHRIDLLLDVGANHGQFARLARSLGYEGEIVSFEPLACCREQLRASAAADGRWRLVPLALGNSPAELDLHVYDDDSFSSLHPINQNGHTRFRELVAETHVERVSVRALDDLWSELAFDVTRRVLLKTDTQGHDLAVLAGAKEVLRQTHAVIAEAALQPIYGDVPMFAEISASLGERGFAVSGVFPISHRAEDLSLIEMDCFFTRRYDYRCPAR